jgi:arylsulfatase B
MNISRRAFLGGAAALYAQPAKHPNVVIFLADDLGFGDTGHSGGEMQTPYIDALARQGVWFDRFYSFPVCSPTRSGLMTGRSPMRLGVVWTVIRPWEQYGLPVEEHIIPQSFKAAGYQTAMTGKWHLGHSHVKFLPQSRGFDHDYGHLNGNIDYYTHMRDGGLDWHRNGKSLVEEGYSTDLFGNEAVRIIKGRDKSKPLFLYMPFNAPHAPLQAPQEILDKYDHIQDKKRRAYVAMVDRLDHNIGRVLKTLDAEGMSKDTIILFFSDNGGPLAQGANNGKLRGAKGSSFEGGLRVPAVIRYDGHLKAGTVTKQVACMMDVFPTLAAAAGITPQNKLPFDGKNLWPALTAGKADPREDLFFAIEGSLAVHHREWKLVRHKGVNMLFRIDRDPYEKDDVAAQHPDMVKDLSARIDKWVQLHPAHGTHPSNDPPAGYVAPKMWIEAAIAP